jgi:membrane fusion protein (multidrug efflux system)
MPVRARPPALTCSPASGHLPTSRRACVGLGFSALVAGLAGLIACSPEAPPPPPPPEIEVVSVLQRDQPLEMEMVGETRGSSDIPVRARVEGVLEKMNFVEGGNVEKGQLLYVIESDPFDSEVVEAEGARAEVDTQLAKAKADLDRIKPLAEMKAVSQSDLDGAVAQYEAALGALQSAKARVEQAKIRQAYTRIRAPISGRIGITAAQVGEFVGKAPNPVVLNYVSQTDPIRVRFSIDERTYMLLARKIREADARSEDERRASRDLRLTLADGREHPLPGRLVATDAAIDPKTGTFTLEADFPNPERLVLAGQFARVRAVAEVLENALLVPSRAVSELQGNYRVYVVNDKGIVDQRQIELGPTIGDLQIVQSGLAAGEHVAIEFMKLRPGMTVKPKLVTLDASGALPKQAELPPKDAANAPKTPASEKSTAPEKKAG